MKRLMAMAIFMIASVSMYGQQYLSSLFEYKNVRNKIMCRIGYSSTDSIFFILIGTFDYKMPLTKLNDNYIISTKDGGISLKVTEHIINECKIDGLFLFPLDTLNLKRISKGVNSIFCMNEHGKKVNKYNAVPKWTKNAEGKFERYYLHDEVPYIIKCSKEPPMKKQNTKETPMKKQNKQYSSWRD